FDAGQRRRAFLPLFELDRRAVGRGDPRQHVLLEARLHGLLEGLGVVGGMDRDEAALAGLDAFDDPRDPRVGDVAVLLVAPPDDDLGPVDVLVRQPLAGILDADRADLAVILLFQVLGQVVAQVVRIDLLLGLLLLVPDQNAKRRAGIANHEFSFGVVPNYTSEQAG